MPLLSTDAQDQAAPQLGLLSTDLPTPSYGEVIKNVPEKVGLSFIDAAGGVTRAIGDMVRSDSLADIGAEISRNARGAGQMLTPENMTLGQKVLSGGAESALQMLPALAVAPASIPAAGIALAAGQQGGQRYSELRDAGFSGGRAGLHASIDALAEGLGEAVSLPVLAQTTRPFLNKLVHFFARDLAGEEFTTVMQQGNAMLSDNPNMTWGQFLEGMKMTALVTPVAAGMQVGAAHAITNLRDAVTPSALAPSAPQPPAPTTETVAKPAPQAVSPTDPPPQVIVDTPPEHPAPTSELPPPESKPLVKPADVPSGWKKDQKSEELGREIYVNPDGMTVEYDDQTGTWSFNDAKGAQTGSGYTDIKAAIDGVKNWMESFAATPTPEPPDATPAGDMYQQTPDEMQKSERWDPRIYDGMAIGTGRISVDRLANGRYKATISIDNGEQVVRIHDNVTAGSMLAWLAKQSKVDIRTDIKAATLLYNEKLITEALQGRGDPGGISDSVAVHFGGKLDAIGGLAEERNQQLMRGESAVSEGRTALANTKTAGTKGLPYAVIPYKAGGIAMGNDPTTLAKHKTTFLNASLSNSPQARKIAAFVESLRAKWLPNISIVVSNTPPLSKMHGEGGLIHTGLGTLNLAIFNSSSATTPLDMGKALQHAAHEFTHIVVHEHFRSLSPVQQAEMVRSWLEYTKAVEADTSFNQYMVQHHHMPRTVSDQKTVTQVSTRYAQYAMGFAEYLADQGSHYFLHRSNTLIVKDPSLKGWFDALLAKLKELWQQLGVRFTENKTFVAWLDGLVDPNHASDTPPRTEDKLPPGAADIRATPPKRPTSIVSKEQAKALLEKAGKLMDELHRAGATKEEVDALSPTGLIADLNWDAAHALADKYGIPKSYYDGPNRRGSYDDTSSFREDIWRMNRSLNDPETRLLLGKANESVTKFRWFLQKTMSAVQLRKKFGEVVPGVKAFVDNLEKMFAYRSRWKEIADERVKQMKDTPNSERTKVFDLMLDEDHTGTFSSTLSRDVTGKRIFTLTPDAIKKYNLTEKGVALYTGLRQDFDAALEEMELQAEAELQRLYSPGPALTKALSELHHGFAEMKARPYVPHTRFGDHTITVREKGIVREFYQFESERDARREELRLRAEYGTGVTVSRGKMTEQTKVMMGLPPQLIGSMKAHLKLTAEQIREFEDLLKDMSQGASFVRRFKRRKNVEGWASDADQFPRAYADYMTRFANHVSRLKYNHTLTASTAQVRAQATEESKNGINTMSLNDLATWLGRLQDYVNDPGVEYTNARAAATIWYLGMNVKSALVNSTSVPMVTLPYLSKRFGWARAMDATVQAYKDIGKQYARIEALTSDERKMLQTLREAGRIDASFASELAGLREGGRLADQTALSKPAAAFFGIKYYGMWMFQKMEVLNREVTALASYRLYRTQRTFAEDDVLGYDKRAAEQASRSIQDTQNENAQWNRAEFMRGRKSVLTMFMSYQQNIMYQMLGGDPAWMRLMAVQLAMAGLMGLPFAQDLDELIKWFNRRVFGSDQNVEKAVRAYLKDVTGNSDWFLHGAAHNIFGLDLSGSLSQGRVIPGVDALAMEGDFPSRLANAAGDVGGAGFSIILNIMKAIASNDPNLWSRAARAVPEFSRSMIEGGKMFSGEAKDAAGNKIADTTTGEAFMRSLGFQVTDVAEERAKRFAQKDTAQYWLSRRAYVLAVYERSVQDRSGEWRSDANKSLHEFNSEVPDRALRITAEQLRESLKRRAVAGARVERDVGPNRMQSQTYRRVGELYGP